MSDTPDLQPIKPEPSSAEPWLCEVPWHSHNDSRRGPTCRPDSIRHPNTTQEPPR